MASKRNHHPSGGGELGGLFSNSVDHGRRREPADEPRQLRRVPGCGVCGHLACVCAVLRGHEPHCKYRISATCPVGIACEPHNRDTCPVCDPCTCEKGRW